MSCVRSRLLRVSVGMSCVRSRLLRVSVGMSCVLFTPALRFCWDVLRSITPALRFCWNVLRSITPAVCRMSAKQDGLREVAFLFRRGSGSPQCILKCRAVIGLVWFTSGLCVSLRRPRRRTKGRGERSRRRGRVRFCVSLLALPCFPRGVRWGLRAPKPAPKSLRLSGLSSRCGGVVLVRIRAAVTRVHGKTRRTPIYGSAGRAV